MTTDKKPDENIANQDAFFMQRAVALADRAEALGEVPVGAVLVCAGEVIGEGWNQPISSCDPTAHAEIMALRDAAKRLNNYRLPGTTLYVTIEPCAMCAGALVHGRVARVVYGALEPKAGVVTSNVNLLDAPHFNHRIESEGGVLGALCAEKISDFFSRRRTERKQAASQD